MSMKNNMESRKREFRTWYEQKLIAMKTEERTLVNKILNDLRETGKSLTAKEIAEKYSDTGISKHEVAGILQAMTVPSFDGNVRSRFEDYGGTPSFKGVQLPKVNIPRKKDGEKLLITKGVKHMRRFIEVDEEGIPVLNGRTRNIEYWESNGYKIIKSRLEY